MKIIGIGHYSRTGKDSLANALIESLHERGLRGKKSPFAGKLKEQAYELYHWAGMREAAFYDTPEGEKYRDVPLAIGLSPVDVWVKLGMGVRDIYSATWVQANLRGRHDTDVLIVPDTRFTNEVEAIRELGGRLIKVVRPGYGPRPTPADTALSGYTGWDLVVGTSGEMRELKEWASRLAWELAGGPAVTQTDAEKEAALIAEAQI